MKHHKNSLTWMAYMKMSVNLENLRDGHYPNGSRLTSKDVIDITEENEEWTEILLYYECDLPVISAVTQLELF